MVLPAVAVGISLMVRKNWVLTDVQGAVPVTVMVSVIMPPFVISVPPNV